MRFSCLVLLLASFWSAAIDRVARAQDDTSSTNQKTYSADAYGSCSACHLPDGAGIPGTFPPIRNRLATIAGLDGGRDYLVTAVSFGLMGTIEVGGMQYFGVMAGNHGSMSAEEIASALNYAVFELADDKDAASAVAEFSADEISNSQSKVTEASPAAAGKLRERMIEQHGEEWPQ